MAGVAWLPEEFQPYRRRITVMVVVAALLGIGLALVVPAGKKRRSTTAPRHALTAPKQK
jgi:hypothetical protein